MKVVVQSVIGAIIFAALLFIPAGTVDYWQGWAYLIIFAVVTAVPSIYLARTDPAALQRRMKAGPTAESRPVQKAVMVGTTLSFLAAMVVPAFDFRFGWSKVPAAVSIVGLVMMSVGLALTMVVILQNRYAAATITVEHDQPLVSTGLYGLVRHPMYCGAVIMMIGTPLALGSYWALLLVLPGVVLLGVRIHDEEKMLVEELPGYREYTTKVRYRMVPPIW